MNGQATSMNQAGNRIDSLFQTNSRNLLSVYFTAGYPTVNSTVKILDVLQECGVDFVEIGIPFSDPIADGETIQHSNQVALKNGMTLSLLFKQLKNVREAITIPIILMGYLNPIHKFGFDNFCKHCRDVGIDGLIIPDLPLSEIAGRYKKILDMNDLRTIMLITPTTEDSRIGEIDKICNGFIYMVSSASTTGGKSEIAEKQLGYFERVSALGLMNPLIVGFGISNRETFLKASKYTRGAIIGSAFIKAISGAKDYLGAAREFVRGIKP